MEAYFCRTLHLFCHSGSQTFSLEGTVYSVLFHQKDYISSTIYNESLWRCRHLILQLPINHSIPNQIYVTWSFYMRFTRATCDWWSALGTYNSYLNINMHKREWNQILPRGGKHRVIRHIDLEYLDGCRWLQNFDCWSYGMRNPVI